MKARLNGWQRLWVIISILYLLPLVTISVMIWPSSEKTWHRDEFITRMPAELRGKIEGAYASKYQWQEARRKNYQVSIRPESTSKGRTTYTITAADGHTYKIEGPAGASPEEVVNEVLRQNPSARFLSDPIEAPNGAVIDVHAAVAPKDMERVATAYWAVVESETRAERWQRAWWVPLVWIIPCLTLYAFGWAIAWVRRGFRSDEPGEPKGQ